MSSRPRGDSRADRAADFAGLPHQGRQRDDGIEAQIWARPNPTPDKATVVQIFRHVLLPPLSLLSPRTSRTLGSEPYTWKSENAPRGYVALEPPTFHVSRQGEDVMQDVDGDVALDPQTFHESRPCEDMMHGADDDVGMTTGSWSA